jgi:hypothetical protein
MQRYIKYTAEEILSSECLKTWFEQQVQVRLYEEVSKRLPRLWNPKKVKEEVRYSALCNEEGTTYFPSKIEGYTMVKIYSIPNGNPDSFYLVKKGVPQDTKLEGCKNDH